MKARLIVLAVLASYAATACGPQSSTPDRRTLTVYAAASLSTTFTEIGNQFESDHRGVEVRFNFGGSSDLVAQLQQGAPADVFASANTDNMDKAVADHLVEGVPVEFATNTLMVVVPADNPAKVTSLADLSREGTQVVVCAPQVPCGSATQKLEKASGVNIAPVSEEQSVTDVLNKVQAGEADAGLVYVTDVRAAGDKVKGIAIPQSSVAVNSYPIAALKDSKAIARQFIDLVTGPTGQRVLSGAGFGGPAT